jgi:eukaryotic translation initiation factor 2C
VQPPRQEKIEHLQEMVQSAVDQWGDTRKKSPQIVIFYRDGLSEGEFNTVAAQELQAINSTFSFYSWRFHVFINR